MKHPSRSRRSYILSFLPLLLTACLAALSYWLALMSARQSWSDAPRGDRRTPDYFVENFDWQRVLDQGQRRSRLTGSRIDHIPDQDVVRLTQPRFNNVVVNSARLQARSDSGLYHSLTGQLRMIGNVTVVREPHKGDAMTMTMTAPELDLDTDRQFATTQRATQILQGPANARSILEARAVTLDNLAGQLTAEQGVRLVVPSRPKG
ncbi:MAG: LPS export ABC transporter periplasmic protein LptC [Burkholderiaceae bacterium]|jgi:LPS export ABC transporter protein LptC